MRILFGLLACLDLAAVRGLVSTQGLSTPRSGIESSVAVATCGATPVSDCRSSVKSLLSLKQKDGTKDRLLWKWTKGEATETQEFGDPTSSADYTLCIYAGDATLAEMPVAASDKWTTIGAKGYKFRDPTATEAGVRLIFLRRGAAGRAKIIVRGKGTNLPDPMLGSLALPITVQLVNGESGLCWESVYGPADVVRLEPNQLRAKSSS